MSSLKKVDLLSVTSWRSYYWLLIKTAFTAGFSIFSATNFLFAFIAWGLAKRYPEWEAVLNDLVWQIPASLGLAAIALRWVVAPFEVHRKTVKQADKRIVTLIDERVEINHHAKKITQMILD